MSDNDLFNNEEKPKDEGTPKDDKPTGVEGVDTYLALIQNEDGTQKYATAADALKGSVHAQSHIQNLEAELKDLRAGAENNKSLEDIMDAINQKQTPTGEPAADKTPGITSEMLTDTVGRLLEERERVSTQENNVTTVTAIFLDRYGEKASETMYTKAKDLGFSRSEINSMIATNPKAALNILGVEGKPSSAADLVTSEGSVMAESFAHKGEVVQKSVMGSTNSKALTEAWEISKAATLKRLEAQM